MFSSVSAKIGLAATALLIAGQVSASAQGADPDAGQAPVRHTRVVHRAQAARPLTVSRRVTPASVVVAAPIVPYAPGPAAIVTAPIHAADTIVGLPFQALGGIFPATGDTPLVLIGAPIQAAGQIARIPFRIVDAAFGAPYGTVFAR